MVRAYSIPLVLVVDVQLMQTREQSEWSRYPKQRRALLRDTTDLMTPSMSRKPCGECFISEKSGSVSALKVLSISCCAFFCCPGYHTFGHETKRGHSAMLVSVPGTISGELGLTVEVQHCTVNNFLPLMPSFSGWSHTRAATHSSCESFPLFF
jgi:hypothetical protein